MVTQSAYVPQRGDAVWITLAPQAGHEQAGRRPAVVLSPGIYNDRVGLALCCPITHQIKGYPFEVVIPPGLRVGGAILADQVKSLDWQARQAEFICALPSHTTGEILQKIGTLLAEQAGFSSRGEVFFGTNLDEILASLEPASIAVAGVNTHACVRTTAIDAYKRDYHVVIASECVASYDDYHRDSLRYLGGRTRIMSTVELSRVLTDSYDRGLEPAGRRPNV